MYGGVGMGKTHLMHAVGHLVKTRMPHAAISYISGEKFTNEMINSVRYDKMTSFRDKFRTVDVLLIDDIQFLAGKERTQEEFFHTFNALHETSKQIVISSDRSPKELNDFEDRLRSRFEWGLVVDIQPPDLETKVAILQRKAEQERIGLPDRSCPVHRRQCPHQHSRARGRAQPPHRVVVHAGRGDYAAQRAALPQAHHRHAGAQDHD